MGALQTTLAMLSKCITQLTCQKYNKTGKWQKIEKSVRKILEGKEWTKSRLRSVIKRYEAQEMVQLVFPLII